MPKPRILIAAGGTAGHVVPALAIADELRASGAQVSFAGTRERSEAQLVPAAGYEIDFIDVTGIDRARPLSALKALANATAAMPAARRVLRSRAPGAVLGGGGYIAGPVGLAAAAMRLPLVLTEADSHLGLANRLLAPLARRVCLAFPIAGRSGGRYLVTGRPVPAAVVDADRGSARESLAIAPEASCLLVFGGSLGARSINECAFAAFSQDAADGMTVLHVSGSRDHDALAARLRELGDPPHYRLFEYLPNLGKLLAACDLVLARAGGSVFEIAAAGRPAILVPYPHATADHQAANARWMADAGAASIVADADLQPAALRELVEQYFDDVEHLERMSRASRALSKPAAAREIADQLLQAAETGRG